MDDSKQGVEGIRADGVVSSPTETIYQRLLDRGQFTSPVSITRPWCRFVGWVANDERGVRILVSDGKGTLHEVVHAGKKPEGPGLAMEIVGDDLCYVITEHDNVSVTPRLNAVVAGRFPGLAAPPPALDFADVPPGTELQDAARWARARGVVSGYDDNTLRPGATITRGQALLMLYRALGK
jgi:hypothetical protein